MVDSVFTPLLETPFPSDRPLIPVEEIEGALDAIEGRGVERQVALIESATEQILRDAEPFLAARNVEGILTLNWNLQVALQRPIALLWAEGYYQGSQHAIKEMRAAVPPSQFGMRYATPAQVEALFSLEPQNLRNSPAEQAVLQRAIVLSGNFSGDTITALKGDLIAAIVPQSDTGQPITREQLLTRIEKTLSVSRNRAEIIARTELTSAYNLGRLTTYNQSEMVTHVKFLAIRDARTTEICRTRNGLIIPKGSVEMVFNTPPLHARCRSVLSPVMPSVNPSHQKWVDDPDRQLENRKLVPLPKGWRTNELPKPAPTPPPPVVAPAPPPKQRKPRAAAFPKSIDKLEEVRSLGGSTGAKLVRDPKTGRQYVLKRGASVDHLREEMAADAAYQALGVNVPRFKSYELADGSVAKLSEFIEGRSLGSVLAAGGDEATAALTALRKDFAADALLGNWDVIGMEYDNILIGNDGKVWRIDNGGSLRFRAQGALKGDRWNNYPTELWSLRNAAVNQQTSNVFGSINHFELVDQIEVLAAKEKALLKALPKELHPSIKGRLTEMRRTAEISRTLQADAWKEGYVSDFTRHSMGIRSTGLVDRLPKELKAVTDDLVFVYDEDGKPFDNLRGPGSHIADLAKYVDANGGDYELVTSWMEMQASDSWSGSSQSLKWFMANQRTIPVDNTFWRFGLDTAEQKFGMFATNQQTYSETFSAFHAFNYELLDKVDFSTKNPLNRTVQLLRTENKSIMEMYGLKVGDTGVTMPRGAIESTSVFETVSVYGTEITVQDVPYHRVIGNYFYERNPGSGRGAFLGDDENEFVAMLDGIKFNYTGSMRDDDGNDFLL